MMRNDPEKRLEQALRIVAAPILSAAVEGVNRLLEGLPKGRDSSVRKYVEACIHHAVSGDYGSIERLWRAQPPENEGKIVFLSPSSGETLSVTSSSEGVRWFRQFALLLGWIAVIPSVSERVGRCIQCNQWFPVARKNQRACGKTCPFEGTIKRKRTEYHRTRQEFERRVERGNLPINALNSMKDDPRYGSVVAKYGQRWLSKTKGG